MAKSCTSTRAEPSLHQTSPRGGGEAARVSDNGGAWQPSGGILGVPHFRFQVMVVGSRPDLTCHVAWQSPTTAGRAIRLNSSQIWLWLQCLLGLTAVIRDQSRLVLTSSA